MTDDTTPPATAFTANGVPISVAARDACLAVMQRPRFTTAETEQAMIEAGVTAEDYTAGRAADRLRQALRRTRMIRPVKGIRGVWEKIS